MSDPPAHFQSHTCAKKFAMLTFLFFISMIHGWSSMRHGLALRAVSFSKLHTYSQQPSSSSNSAADPSHKGLCTHQHAMKYLKFSLHLMPSSGSSFNSGIGCLTMYVNKSMRPWRAWSLPSAWLPKGKRCCATSRSVTPNDHTSDVIV